MHRQTGPLQGAESWVCILFARASGAFCMSTEYVVTADGWREVLPHAVVSMVHLPYMADVRTVTLELEVAI